MDRFHEVLAGTDGIDVAKDVALPQPPFERFAQAAGIARRVLAPIAEEDCRHVHKSLLGRRAPDVLSARTFWSLTDIELDTVTLTQILEPFAVHGTLVTIARNY